MLGDKTYRGQRLQELAEQFGLTLDTASPPPEGKLFQPQPVRWRVERFFSWLVKWRRIARAWGYGLAGFAADLAWAALGLQLRRTATACAV